MNQYFVDVIHKPSGKSMEISFYTHGYDDDEDFISNLISNFDFVVYDSRHGVEPDVSI
jgi:hypothetical protein